MDERKQYAKKVVTNIIHFMAQAGAGIKPSKEEIEAIPEEFYADIMASLLAARECKKITALKAMSKIFPLGEILEKIKEEAKKQSEED